jgi:hypothetical protein
MKSDSTKCRRVHHRKEQCDVFIGRPSKWGSPFSNKPNSTAPFKVNTRREAVDKHKEWLLNGDGRHLLNDLNELKGKVLGCWCDGPIGSCHGDILVKLVNNLDRKGIEDIFI